MFTISGSFKNLERFLAKMMHGDVFTLLEGYGQEGVRALQAFTPVESGVTASSWTYEIDYGSPYLTISWSNSNVVNGFSVAVGLQHGHGTGTGGYVVGRDYINPALKPVFDRIAEKVWLAVTNA